MKSKKLKIKVWIAERPYSVTIEGEKEEEIVRAAAKSINNRVDVFRKQFEADILQYVSMAALQEGVDRLRMGDRLDHRVDLLTIDNLNKDIESCLKSTKPVSPISE